MKYFIVSHIVKSPECLKYSFLWRDSFLDYGLAIRSFCMFLLSAVFSDCLDLEISKDDYTFVAHYKLHGQHYTIMLSARDDNDKRMRIPRYLPNSLSL